MGSVTISEVRRGPKGTAEWIIKNWAKDFDVLKTYAKCVLVANEDDGCTPSSPPAPVEFQFSLKSYDETSRNGITSNSWLSLMAELISDKVPTPIIMTLNVDTNTTNPAEIRGRRKIFTTPGTCIKIQERFIHLQRYSYDTSNRLTSTEDIPKDSEFQFKICVSTSNFANVGNRDGEADKNEMNNENSTGLIKSVEEQVSSSLSKDLAFFFNAEDNLSDLKLETIDGVTLRAHRFILAARSPVLRNMIMEQIKKEDLSGTLKLSTVTSKPLAVILHWMYSGELHENIGKCMEQVVEICRMFEIPELLEILDEQLITVCSTDNMLQLFHVAQLNDMTTAKEDISQFIKTNIDKV